MFDVAPWTQAASASAGSGQRFYLLSRPLSTLAVYDHPNRPARFRRVLAHRPTALAISPRGRIYLAETAASRIRVLSPTGQPVRTIPVAHHHPVSLAVLNDGRLVVAAPRMNGTLLHLFDPSGREVMGFGEAQRFDVGNEAENLFLNRGVMLVDGSGGSIMCFDMRPGRPSGCSLPIGNRCGSSPSGAVVALQVAAVRRFLREKGPEVVGE